MIVEYIAYTPNLTVADPAVSHCASVQLHLHKRVKSVHGRACSFNLERN